MACSLRFNSTLELIPWAALPAAEQADVRAIGGIDRPPAIVRPLPGRLATVTTEAVTLASGGQRHTAAAFALLQTLLPAIGFVLAAWVGRWQRARIG